MSSTRRLHRFVRDLPLRHKLAAMTLMTSVGGLLAAFFVVLVVEIETYRSEMIENRGVLAEVLAENVAAALYFEDTEATKTVLGSLSSDPLALGACVHGPDGECFAGWTSQPEPMPCGGQVVGAAVFGDSSLEVSRPVVVDGEPVGVLSVTSSTRELGSRLTQLALALGVVLIGVVAVVMLVSARIRRALSAPLLELVAAAREAGGANDYSVRVEPRGGDEVGELARAFNRMLTQIEERETDLLDAKDRAEQADRTKSGFLANMSHELRTPLNGVVGMVSYLLETKLDGEQRSCMETVRASAESLLVIMNDILDLSKTEAGKITLRETDFDLREHVRETCALFTRQVKEKELRLVVDVVDDAPAWIHADSGLVRHALTNLVSNAIRFTHEGEIRVRVSVERDDGPRVLLRLSVEDTGIGIEEEALGELFKPFVQVDGSATREYGGTGLGLAITRGLVERMGGTIGAKSAFCEGSTFWFTVDVARAEAPVPGESASDAGGVSLNAVAPRTILIVEDTPLNQKIAQRMLERLGYRTQLANDGVEAVELFSETEYDLVLMDCHMPRLDGWEATREIRAFEAGSGRRVPILALTADAREQNHDRCMEVGMDGFLTKPIRIGDLESALGAWFEAAGGEPTERAA